MKLDVNNFENYTADEYRNNLLRLGALSHSSLVGKTVYYSQKAYGKHSSGFLEYGARNKYGVYRVCFNDELFKLETSDSTCH